LTVEIKSTKKKAKKEVKLEEAAILAPVGHKQSKFDLPAIMLLCYVAANQPERRIHVSVAAAATSDSSITRCGVQQQSRWSQDSNMDYHHHGAATKRMRWGLQFVAALDTSSEVQVLHDH